MRTIKNRRLKGRRFFAVDFKLGFIVQFAVDHVGAIIDRPCMKILRIRIDFGEFERMCRGGRSLSAPTISTEGRTDSLWGGAGTQGFAAHLISHLR